MAGFTKKNEIAKVPSMTDGKFLLKAIKHTFSGSLILPKGHIPKKNHSVAENFIGVGVATSGDPLADHYIIDRLHELNIKSVRIDLSYGDIQGNAGRLLKTLVAENFDILLHLIQPFNSANNMENDAAQKVWRDFVIDVCEQFGSDVSVIEIGSTINRRRWAGYNKQGFFSAWKIAYQEIKSRGITIAGPNISDFEPFYSLGFLDELAELSMLPDIHTSNLFAERVTEPERYDHRVLGFKWTKLFKYNLVKKARLMHQAGLKNGVSRFMSPSAFWTLDRIKRVRAMKQEKQADYLTRYFVLLAASGVLEKAFWGPLICAREGLIDDGSRQYPDLERITHYASIFGSPDEFRVRPSFLAMKQMIASLSGATYIGALATTNELEVHAFEKGTVIIHIAWTIDGKNCALDQLYSKSDLDKANFKNRDGTDVLPSPHFINESPTFIYWNDNREVALLSSGDLTMTSVFAHTSHGQTFPINSGGWSGILTAHSDSDAERIVKQLHPEKLPEPSKDSTFRKARNIIWTVPGLNGEEVVVKKPHKVAIQKRLFDHFKPSKSRRSWNATAELSRRGISTARAIAFFEKSGDKSMLENVFICEKVDHDFSVREMFIAFREGATSYQGLKDEAAYFALSNFLHKLHGRGVFFRDLSGGNVLVKKKDDSIDFTLIDVNRARFYNHPLNMLQRLSDLTRITYKLHWEGRILLVGDYLNKMRKSKNFTFTYRIPFYLYDIKVNFKRKYGRRAIKKLGRSIREMKMPSK